jgi:hypothetical protein
MAVSDLILVAGLKRTVGIAYLQKLLGPAMNSASALQKKAERLRNAHANRKLVWPKLMRGSPEQINLQPIHHVTRRTAVVRRVVLWCGISHL